MHTLKKISVLALFLPLFAFVNAHKFYVSTSNVRYSEKEKAVQIISRVFADDLEKTIDQRYGIRSRLATPKEDPKADTYLERYYTDKFIVKVDGKTKKFRFIGKEYKEGMIVSYLEIPDTPLPSSLEIENRLLYETYPEQQNIVHIRAKNIRKSFLLLRDDDHCLLNL
ncbi:DUF6702 family protein [Sinomicrobium weinanense]|uniref:Uncharacterized protein n=1 Tax=Sinomicrobium weinanense TaxID=2842200 RepID=A0A926JUC9_9FLAO|nr:DUF6702 family protein [Sinomicrobium weinanense]MBC9797645.1 hypothetical protein [Sinomicrobium weinanense]MBU3122673.1 hypothetical protein [Sinomicrobium weinanense]